MNKLILINKKNVKLIWDGKKYVLTTIIYVTVRSKIYLIIVKKNQM